MSRRAALVTGGSAGIGLAVARRLASDGYAITIAARRQEQLQVAEQELERHGAECLAVAANLAQATEIDGLVEAHRARFGRLDVLVNNVGVGLVGPIADADVKQIDLHLNLNVRAAYLMMRSSVPMLREAGAAHGKALVVNVSSIFGKLPHPYLAAYSATKAALIALSQSAHGELSSAGVQVCALCPSWVDTPGTEWMTAVERSAMIHAEDVAEAVQFLLRTSPQCAIPEITMVSPGANLFHVTGAPD